MTLSDFSFRLHGEDKLALVVDANVLFAALIRSGKSEELLCRKDVAACAPEFLIDELESHLQTILDKTNRPVEEFTPVLSTFKRRVKLFKSSEFEAFKPAALAALEDKADAPYLALALFLRAPIWSNDKQLKKQALAEVFSTAELLALLGEPQV